MVMTIKPSGWLRIFLFLLFFTLTLFWVRGFPSLTFSEPLDWIPYFILVIAFSTLNKSSIIRIASCTSIFFVSLVIYSWPILENSNALIVFLEIGLFAFILLSISSRQVSLNHPALVICITATGLALVTLMSGSALLAQLAGIIAALLGGFVLYEFRPFKAKLKTSPQLDANEQLFFSSLVLSLIFISRIYTEIPLLACITLALSLLLGFLVPLKTSFLISLILSGSAVIYVSLTKIG